MSPMDFIIGFVVGTVLGAGVALVVSMARASAAQKQMRETFAALASEALDGNSRRLVELLDGNAKRLNEAAGAALDGKKALIDQSVQAINERLEKVRQLLQSVETQRQQDFGRLSQSMTTLATTTGELHRMLASTQRRGAWGERMAEDVLRLAGLQENINYVKQSTADAADGTRPDFTFLLPNDLKVNMDVKFPLEKYKAYVDCTTDADRAKCLRELCAAVRAHIRDVVSRGYIDPKVPTVPYVIVFIPSEQIFSLVMECQGDLIDEALRLHVVLCGPLTLYAKLAIMRQAAENFNIMKTADEIIEHLAEFRKQWEKYTAEFDKLGLRIDDAAKQFELVRSTRSNMLQRPLDKIDSLRQRALPGKED